MAESFTPSPLSSTTFTLHEMYGDGQIKGNTTYDLPDLTHSRLLTPARPNNVKQRTDSLPTKTHRRPPHKTTAAQKRILLAAFEDDPNPPAGKRERLAKQLNVERRIIKNWFSNQRALRRRLGQGYRGYADSFHSGSTSSCSASGSGDELELELEGETRRVGASESIAGIEPQAPAFGFITGDCMDIHRENISLSSRPSRCDMLRIPENVFHLPVLLPPHSTYNLKSFSPQKQKPRLVVAPPLASFLPLPSTSPSFNMSPSSWSPLDDLYTQPGDSEREQKWERHHPFPFFPPSRSRLHDITPDIDLPAVLQGYPESALRSSLTMLV